MPKENTHAFYCKNEHCIKELHIMSQVLLRYNNDWDCYEHPEIFEAAFELMEAYREKLTRENRYPYCICLKRTYNSSGPYPKVNGVCSNCKKIGFKEWEKSNELDK